jgi:hypothetical protein
VRHRRHLDRATEVGAGRASPALNSSAIPASHTSHSTARR